MCIGRRRPLSKEFNAWMLGKLFYGVEDIYVPDQSGKSSKS